MSEHTHTPSKSRFSAWSLSVSSLQSLEKLILVIVPSVYIDQSSFSTSFHRCSGLFTPE